MKRKFIIIGCILAFLCGVFLFDFFRHEAVFALLPVFLLLCFGPKIPLRAAFLWNVFFLLGILRVFLNVTAFSPEEIAFYAKEQEAAEKVEITGTVVNFPDIREDKTKVYLETKTLEFSNGESKNITGKILVNLSKYPSVHYGDELKIAGELQIPPVWEDFSYRRFLEKEGVHAYVPWSTFEILNHDNGSVIFGFLFHVRAGIENTLRRRIPEPEASFAVGILLGGERGFSEEIIEEFRITGLSHLLALSGFNITILILFVFWIFRLLPQKMNLLLTLLFVTGFVLLTGASASVVRAAVMGLIALIVLHFGSEGKPAYILLWSIFVITLWNPFLIYSDISFQLSVAAVLGLIFFVPIWQQLFEKISRMFGVREALETTLAAQITALPLVAYYFRRISLISPVANLLIAPLIPLAMLCSFLTLLPGIGSIFAFLAYGVLHIALNIVHWLAQIPGADVGFRIGISVLGILYVVGISVWWRKRRKNVLIPAVIN